MPNPGCLWDSNKLGLGVWLLCLRAEARRETVSVYPGLGYSLMISWCLPLSIPWSEATSLPLAQVPGEPFRRSSSCLCPSELPGEGQHGEALWGLQAELAGFEAEQN